MLDGREIREYSPTEEEASGYSSINTVAVTPTSSTKSKKNKNKNKRRFSDEQIRSLESIFENESRLEPRQKLDLAKDLGLQPRQVAIWFQNKRARWKSKQLQRDYDILQANYNSLASRFESLKKENFALTSQLQKLNEKVQKTGHQGQSSWEQGRSESNGDASKSEQEEVKPRLSFVSDEDSGTKAEYLRLEQEQDKRNLLSMMEPGDESFTSREDWGSLDSGCLFDNSSNGYQWWDVWS